MKEQLTIVKLGGNCMDDQSLLHSFLRNFTELPGTKILVHGGGKIASQLGKKLGIPVQMIDGRRVTDTQTLDLITMVFAGLLNKKIVAHLQSLGCNAMGLSGADGNLVQSRKRSAVPVDFGFAGDPQAVNCGLLNNMRISGLTPVIAPVTHDGMGQLLNTNADTIASVIASSLSAYYDVHLLFAFDKNGVLENPADDSSVVSSLSKSDFVELKENGKIHNGMLPKLRAGFDALEKGVLRVTLQHVTALRHDSPATQLTL